MEAASLRQASGELQPRDRARAESVVGVRERAARLDPSRLLPQRRSDSGAPIVSPDGTILSGNGRVLSIREAYKDPKLIRAYRATVLTKLIGWASRTRWRRWPSPSSSRVSPRSCQRPNSPSLPIFPTVPLLPPCRRPRRAMRDAKGGQRRARKLPRRQDLLAQKPRLPQCFYRCGGDTC